MLESIIIAIIIIAMIFGTLYLLVRAKMEDIHVHPLVKDPRLPPPEESKPKETVEEAKKTTATIIKTYWVWVRKSIWSKPGKIILGILLILALWALFPSTYPYFSTLWPWKSNPPVAPYGKTVGGPLRWNNEAKVKLRPRMNRERVDEKGACFAGIIPPGSWMDIEFAAYHQSEVPWMAVLLDHGYVGRFLPPNLMQQHAVSRRDVHSGVLDLYDLPRKGKHAARITDRSVSAGSKEGFKVSEWYLQSSPGGPEEVVIDIRKEPKGTYQYLVEVGLKKTSINLPHQNWKWIWIVPIHTNDYRASMDEIPVPAEGSSVSELKHHLGIIAKVNGEESVLEKSLLLQPSGETVDITLFLHSASQILPEGVKPARIIVGIQM